MATKEDILEQLAEEYLTQKGYFVQHNLKFRPSRDHPDFDQRQDSNHSDIDVLGFHPQLTGPDRVWAISCKSWQSGFKPADEIRAIEKDLIRSGRKRWKSFRELCVAKWADAFIDKIEDATGTREFTYVTAVSHVKGDPNIWTQYRPFADKMHGNPIRILSFSDIVSSISKNLTTTLAGTEIGRMLQMFRAAGITFDIQHNTKGSLL